jgi:hypothetical protein
MISHYSSFLIRCRRLASGAGSISIEHVQSGEEAIVPTLDAAVHWIGARGAPPDPARTQYLASDGAASPRATNESSGDAPGRRSQ